MMITTLPNAVTWITGLFLASVGALVIYRLYISPLARFPGPKLAAATSLYAFYYDVMYQGGGRYIWVIEEMHRRYGPIVRISPNTIHINDPSFIDQVFGSATKRRDKGKLSVNGIGLTDSIIGTIGHDLHRRRRAPLNQFFSKTKIRGVEPIIQHSVDKIMERLDQQSETGAPMRLVILFAAGTHDIISEYCFGQSTNNLDLADLNEPFFNAVQEGSATFHFDTYFPFLYKLLRKVPTFIMMALVPIYKVWLDKEKSLEIRIEEIRESLRVPKAEIQPTETIFHKLLSSDLSKKEQSSQRLIDEANVLEGAGTHTTALMASVIVFLLLSNPHKLAKLKAELRTAIPDSEHMPTATEIERLPYLTAIIQEALRMFPPVSSRLERSAPDEDITYENNVGTKFVIPRGTVMCMTSVLLGRLENIYPDPLEFRPERFIENPKLTQYQLTFSRGTRHCIGINLAYMELYLLIARIFRKYDCYDNFKNKNEPTLQLYRTTMDDVALQRDMLLSTAKEGSLGVRVTAR